MIKETSYNYNENETPGRLTRRTNLIAELRFQDETVQSDLLNNRETFDLNQGSKLADYLCNYEKLQPAPKPEYGYRFRDSKRTLTISNPPFTKQALDLRVETEGEQVPKKELFDLDAFNEFILTGRMKQS